MLIREFVDDIRWCKLSCLKEEELPYLPSILFRGILIENKHFVASNGYVLSIVNQKNHITPGYYIAQHFYRNAVEIFNIQQELKKLEKRREQLFNWKKKYKKIIHTPPMKKIQFQNNISNLDEFRSKIMSIIYSETKSNGYYPNYKHIINALPYKNIMGLNLTLSFYDKGYYIVIQYSNRTSIISAFIPFMENKPKVKNF